MNKKFLLLSLLALTASVLAACSGAATPTPSTRSSQAAPGSTPNQSQSASAAQPPDAKATGAKFESKSNEGGSVTVEVTPTALEVGKPIVFEIGMNTHSVDLSDDMTKIVILRDDNGKEYQPTAWEGPGGGGHHREGALKFAALSGKPKYVELVIKDLAQVPERVFRWEVNW